MKIFWKKNHMVGWTKGWHNFRFLVPFENKGLDVLGKRAVTSSGRETQGGEMYSDGETHHDYDIDGW